MTNIYQEIHRDLTKAQFTRVCQSAGWQVDSTLAEFSRVLDAASDEKPVQRFLEDNLWLVAARWSHSCAWVRAEVPMGSRYRADFLVGTDDSYPRVQWTMVELESPRAALFTTRDREALKLREGITQVRDWRRWLTEYGRIAREPVKPGGEGLGYREIDRGARGAVVIGRRSAMSDSDRVNRRNAELDARIRITSYDSMIDRGRSWATEVGPCPGCEYVTGAAS